MVSRSTDNISERLLMAGLLCYRNLDYQSHFDAVYADQNLLLHSWPKLCDRYADFLNQPRVQLTPFSGDEHVSSLKMEFFDDIALCFQAKKLLR